MPRETIEKAKETETVVTYVLKVSKHKNSYDSMWRYYMYTRMRSVDSVLKVFQQEMSFGSMRSNDM